MDLEKPGTIQVHVCVFQYSDYTLDYARFFYANRDLLRRSGIAYPALTFYPKIGMMQWTLWSVLRRIAEANAEEGEVLCEKFWNEIAEDLTDVHHVLFVIPAGNAGGLPALLQRRAKSEAKGIGLAPYCLWIAQSLSCETEGKVRYFLPGEWNPCGVLDQFESFLDGLTRMVEFFGKENCTVLPDKTRGRLSSDAIIEALHLPLDPKECIPVEDMRIDDRDLCYYMQGLRLFMPWNGLDNTEALREKSAYSDSFATFVSPDILQSVCAYDAKLLSLIQSSDPNFPCFESIALTAHWEPFIVTDVSHLTDTFVDFVRHCPSDTKHLLTRIARVSHRLSSVKTGMPEFIPQSWERLEISAPPEPLCSVLTLTKNHERYLLQCLESVTAQETSFRVQHIVVDDCSTDRTRELLYEYAKHHEHVVPIFLNGGAPPGRNVRALFTACRSRYAALCDGDDYFIDTHKLQKQVSFLESHPDFTICFHTVNIVYEDGSPTVTYPPAGTLPGGDNRPFYTIKDLLFANIMETASVMYRWRFTDGVPDWFDDSLIPGDWSWHLLHAEQGLIGYLPEIMSVYRRHAASFFSTADRNPIMHHKQHGMEELRFYHVMNLHFRKGFELEFSQLADGILSAFLQVYMRTGDSSLLEEAVDRYPEFSKKFLQAIL